MIFFAGKYGKIAILRAGLPYFLLWVVFEVAKKGTIFLFRGRVFRGSVNSFFGHVNENDTILFNCQRTS